MEHLARRSAFYRNELYAKRKAFYRNVLYAVYAKHEEKLWLLLLTR